jgi:RNA polymerase sigma-70 factor (ECF subfamily)
VNHAAPIAMPRHAPSTTHDTRAEGVGVLAALMADIERGDRDALAAFFEHWFERAMSFVARLTRRDEAFCLDVVQDAMLRVARHARRVESDDAARAWMLRVLTSCAMDHLRAEARRAKREARAGIARDAHEPGATPPSERAWLREAVARLDERDRRLLMERFAHGRTLASIAEAAGLTLGAAHGRIRRALAELAREGGPDGA